MSSGVIFRFGSDVNITTPGICFACRRGQRCGDKVCTPEGLACFSPAINMRGRGIQNAVSYASVVVLVDVFDVVAVVFVVVAL